MPDTTTGYWGTAVLGCCDHHPITPSPHRPITPIDPMGRSIKKGPFVDHHLMEKIVKAKEIKSKTPIKTWSRRSVITPDFVGLTFTVHNGKVFNPVFVTENMVGHRLGEVSPTRIFRKHGAHTGKAEAK